MTPPVRFFTLDDAQNPQGPFDRDLIRSMFVAGRLKPDSLVCPEGGQDWIALQQSGILSDPTTSPQPTIEVTPRAETWGTGTFVALIILTVLFPIFGFIFGILGVTKPANKQKGAALFVLSIIFGLLWYFLIIQGLVPGV